MGFDENSYQIAWAQARGPASPFEPSGDPLGSANLNQRAISVDRLMLVRGQVVDSIAYLHAYRVQCEGMVPTLICTLGAQTAFLPFGARSLNTLPPGAMVTVSWRPGTNYGLILACEPPPGLDPALALCGWLAMSSRCGIGVDMAHQAIFQAANSGNVPNWAGGRPRDSTTAGEWGAIWETGLRIAGDSFMVQLAVDEATGVFGFYHDQLLRVAGVNLQEFSAAHVRESGDDQGETLGYHGWTPYPWEQFGAFQPATDATRSVAPSAAQGTTPYYASREPAFDDQVPFHRRVFLGGYVGQAGKDLIQVPPPAPSSPPPTPPMNRLSNPAKPASDYTALLEEQRTLAGGYSLRAAKNIHIAKQAMIPAPRRLKRPEDATGDTPASYNPAGIGANGVTQTVAADVAVTAKVPGQPAAAYLDGLAMARNWEGEHALHYHTLDWRVPDESETQAALDFAPLPLADLATKFAVPPPDPVSIQVDQVYGEVDYTPTEAGLHILDDGTVVISDGYGSSIKMTGGNVLIQPAGDLIVQSGRSVTVIAGRDISLRARKSAELVAGAGDLRLKADNNLHALAGNSGTGGLLLESRGADAYTYKGVVGTDVVSGGIQMKSAGSVVSWAQGYYIRALDGGDIVLDADRGNGSVFQWADQSVRYLADGGYDYFGTPTDVAASNTFTAAGNSLAGGLTSLGAGAFTQGLTLGSDLQIVNGYIYSDQSSDNGGSVGAYGAGESRGLKAQLNAGQSAQDSANKGGESTYDDTLEPAWYAEGQPGDPDLIPLVGFSFRTTEQYQATDFACWEASWQQQARLAKLTLGVWTEPPVAAGTLKTYPYPGQVAWARDSDYYKQDLNLYDPALGCAVDRAKNQKAYEQPAYADPKPVVLDGNYAVIDPD